VENGNTVDHASGCSLDCRVDNLRSATKEQQAQNRRTPRNNTSGFKGVHKRTVNRFRAQIGFKGEIIRLGDFEDPRRASEYIERLPTNYSENL
jgi:hypothetical protein